MTFKCIFYKAQNRGKLRKKTQNQQQGLKADFRDVSKWGPRLLSETSPVLLKFILIFCLLNKFIMSGRFFSLLSVAFFWDQTFFLLLQSDVLIRKSWRFWRNYFCQIKIFHRNLSKLVSNPLTKNFCLLFSWTKKNRNLGRWKKKNFKKHLKDL